MASGDGEVDDAIAPALAPAEARDQALRARFAAAFASGAADAWSALADPAAATPSGRPSPAARLRAARSGLYRRTPTGRQEYDRVAAEVVAERRAALAALATARGAASGRTPGVTESPDPAAGSRQRLAARPLLIAAVVAALVAAVVVATFVTGSARRSPRLAASSPARVAVAFPVPMTSAEQARVEALFDHATTDPVGATQLTRHLLGDAEQVHANDGALAANGTADQPVGARQAGLAVGAAEVAVPDPDGDLGDTLLVLDLARAARWRAVIARRGTDGSALPPIEVSGSADDGRVQMVRLLHGLDGVPQTVRISAPGVRFAFAVLLEQE